ncbi:MAG: hypothetical protein AUI47_06985 [Acidobacteria bacterium 13_1_40CM_2_68_5]|nr:MAG: hypothetical protein AUI47_06985 [Acidobacteria bacterium 13_1_40CM_2_68_5]
MGSWKSCFALRLFAVSLAIVGACLTVASAGSSAALGTAATVPDASATNVVLTGSYGCQILTSSYVSAPGAEPLVVRELAHAISINGTGASASVAPSAIGPGIGGVRGRPVPEIVPVNLGSGVGNGFDGGTLEDWLHFAEAVRSVAGALGCALSPLRTRQAVVPLSTPGVQFSFVCEGPAPDQIHAIAELDRVVVAQRMDTE